MKLPWRTLFAVVALIAALGASSAQASGPTDVVLEVPFRSQLDGTVWASSNCGPTAISMVLAAYDKVIPTKTLRDRANQLLGIADPSTGTRIQDLARIVSERGLSVFGPYDGKRFQKWTLDDVREQIRAGRPVVPQVYYPLLPNHRKNPVVTDHYIVIVGVTGDSFIFNDSADRYSPGYRQTMTAAEFSRAWGASKVPFGAFSVGPGETGRALLAAAEAAAPTQPVTDPIADLAVASAAGDLAVASAAPEAFANVETAATAALADGDTAAALPTGPVDERPAGAARAATPEPAPGWLTRTLTGFGALLGIPLALP